MTKNAKNTNHNRYLIAVLISVFMILTSDSDLCLFDISEYEHLALGMLLGLYGVLGLVLSETKPGAQ